MAKYLSLFAILMTPLAGAWALDFPTSDPRAVFDAAKGIPSPEGADITALEELVRYRATENGRMTVTERMLIRAVTDAGVRQIDHYSQYWLAWRQNKPLLAIRVITPDGQAHLLDPNTISEAGIPNQVQGLFTDVKVLSMPLPAVTKGALVEIETQVEDREAADPGGKAERWPVTTAIAHLKVIIDVPAQTMVHVATPGVAGVKRTETHEDGRQQIQLEASDLPAPRQLNFAPEDVVTTPAVIFSTVPDWRQLAGWYSEIIEPQIGEKQPAAALRDPQTRISEIETILADIQKTVRYTGVEFGMSAYVPRPPRETLTRGYGDCKDKAALLVSRLRKAGIAANLALLNPFPGADAIEDVPGLEMFSHAIVYVPGAHPLWIDPAAEFAPARNLPRADQGRLALIVDPRTEALTRTPESKRRDDVASDTFTLQLVEDGKPALSLLEQVSGVGEEYSRAIGAQVLGAADKSEGTNLLEQLMGVEKISSADWGNPKDLSVPYRLRAQGDGFRNAGGNEQAVYAFVPKAMHQQFGLSSLLLAAARDEQAAKKRTEDYELRQGFAAEETWKVIPPRGFKVTHPPGVQDTVLGPLTLHRKLSLGTDGSVTVVYRLDVAKHRFTVAEAKQIGEAIQKPELTGFLRLDFMPEGLLVMNDGKWKEGIDLLRRDASANPPRVGALLRYAAALLTAGLRDEAAKTCRRAIDSDPKSAHAYEYLSLIYRYDRIGRYYKPGIDLAEAEKAIRKALELDPANKNYVSELAVIEEADASGDRFEDPKRLAEAIRLLQGIASDLKDNQPDLLPEALLFARRFADLKAFYLKDEASGARIDLRLAAIAGSDGVEAAVRESHSIQSNEESRNAALQKAARDLMMLGDYPKAADLFDAAGVSGQNTVSASDLDLLRRARRGQELRVSKDPVIAVVQQYIFALCDRNASPKHEELLAPEWRSLNWTAQRFQLLALLRGYSRVAQENLWTRAIADIAVSNIEFVKEGDDAGGYRVRFADPAANGTMKTIAWVVRRGEGYKILGLRGDEATSGAEAMALAKKGDLENARRWLDWEREEIVPATSSDPLASQPFLKLWPAAQDPPGADAILAAAASLAARGNHFREGLETLQELKGKTLPGTMRMAIDQSSEDGFRLHWEYEEELPLAESLYKAFPSSASALRTLGAALTNSGRTEDALKLAASVKQTDRVMATAAGRIRAGAYWRRQEYAEAAEAYRGLCASNKGEAGDWNGLAWMTLFAAGTLPPDLKAAETAVRMTQGRNPSLIHTLAAVQADMGKVKEAREGLLHYLGNRDEIDPSAWYLEGRIAESLGLKDAALDIYGKLPKPAHGTGDDVYDLAQLRMATLHTTSH